MASAARSLRQQQRDLASQMRERQCTWVQIAHDFRDRFGVNMRVALRVARDWSQRDAADRWNQRWPADPKTFKNFSYWELWPGRTGHAPSLEVLGRLAELYECRVADLVDDCADFRASDPAHRDRRQFAELSDATGATRTNGNDDPADVLPVVDAWLHDVESTDVHELARLASVWSQRMNTPAARRALLLKLSAGLSLAAASPTLGETDDSGQSGGNASPADHSGIWHSRYVYPSTGRGGDHVGEHYVVVRHRGDRLIAQSIEHSSGSRLRLDLELDAPLATGTWSENTSPDGYYRGALYHGTLQLVVDPSGRSMSGMWLGFGRDFTINSGEWMLTWQDGSTAKSAQRRYYAKVS